MFEASHSLSAFDKFEYCVVGSNPAIKAARKTINKITIPRAETEDSEIRNIVTNDYGDTRICAKCSLKGIKKKYPISTMMKIVRKTKSNGRIIKMNFYLCPECAKKYKPRSKRVGCNTY